MASSRYSTLAAALAATGIGLSAPAYAEETGRRIEEIVVTAEKREATVSDTSISITAFSQETIEDLGIQGADELVNFTPSTTRDNYDIRIRGVGRNFRALGGDPGVGTYYNGVYSEDFGIAASEAALYDVARVEVLRGPQGTLYGRNSVGGALNYITNRPSYEVEAELRFLAGNLGTEEWYGVLSGPLIEDKLAYRFVGVRRDRDGAQDGLDDSEDTNSIGDQNLALALNWRMTDNMEFNVRYNDRDSDRRIGNPVLVNEGHGQVRGARDPNLYALGVVDLPDPIFFGTVGYTGPQWNFTDPNTGAVVPGIYARPGSDISSSIRPSPSFGVNPDVLQSDIEDLGGDTLTNDRNDETFKHNAVQADWVWDINETTQFKLIGGWSDFDYTFFQDFDRSVSNLSQYHQRVIQSLENWSLEGQLLWQIGDDLQITSGIYYFDQDLRQRYSVNDDAAQGRFVNATNYGGMAPFVAALGEMKNLRDAPVGQGLLGRWDGEASGATYAIDNKVNTEAFALYSQGTYTFNEEWALTLGARYATDDKQANEQRFAYLESSMEDGFLAEFTQPVFEAFCTNDPSNPVLPGLGQTSCSDAGLTYTGVMNIFMGNAIPRLALVPGDPAQALDLVNAPLVPTCALDDPDCATPLRLEGLPISFAEASNGKDEWDDVNFRVNMDWTPNDSTLVYASVTTGYRAGGYSLGLLGTQTEVLDENGEPIPLTTAAPRTYDEETVVAYEIGYKGSLFDDTLQLFSALYYYDYEGYQDEVEEFNAGTGDGDNVVINAGDATNWGWEIEGVWLPTDNWTIGGNYSYSDTQYDDEVLIVVDDDPNVPNTLLTPLVVDLEGNDLKRIPQNKATAYSFYDVNFPVGTLTFGGSVSYTGQFYDTGVKRDLDRVRSRYRADVSAIWRDNRDRWYIRAFVDNVTDEGSARGIGTGTGGNNWQQTATYLYPRFYGVDVTFRFGDLL